MDDKKLTEEDRTKLRGMAKFSLFLDGVTAMISLAAEKGKTEYLEKLDDLMKSFQNSLDSEEKKAYVERVGALQESKIAEFVGQLKQSFSDAEIEEILRDVAGGLGGQTAV